MPKKTRRAVKKTDIFSDKKSLHRKTDTGLRAGEGVRTLDNDVGNVVLCQLSYARLRTLMFRIIRDCKCFSSTPRKFSGTFPKFGPQVLQRDGAGGIL